MPGGRAKITPATDMEMQSFAEFWPFYVRAHSRGATRTLHATGSLLAIACIVAGFVVSRWFFAAAPVIGYAFAWFAHFFVEHNRPATFGHPFYSLAADYVMLWKILTGRMGVEVDRHCR